jgi:hypothetical protein
LAVQAVAGGKRGYAHGGGDSISLF